LSEDRRLTAMKYAQQTRQGARRWAEGDFSLKSPTWRVLLRMAPLPSHSV